MKLLLKSLMVLAAVLMFSACTSEDETTIVGGGTTPSTYVLMSEYYSLDGASISNTTYTYDENGHRLLAYVDLYAA